MEKAFREAFQAFAQETLDMFGQNPALAETPIAVRILIIVYTFCLYFDVIYHRPTIVGIAGLWRPPQTRISRVYGSRCGG